MYAEAIKAERERSEDWRNMYERVLLAAPEVAGVKFYAGCGTLRRLAPGSRLKLVRERANRHDRCAVCVYGPGGEKIGYVPRFAAPLVAGAIDRGKRVAARVCRVDAYANSVVMRIYEYKPRAAASSE